MDMTQTQSIIFLRRCCYHPRLSSQRISSRADSLIHSLTHSLTHPGKVQNTCKDFETLWKVIHTPLPVSFRINPTSKYVLKVRRDLDSIWTRRDNILIPGTTRRGRDADGNLTTVTVPSKVVSPGLHAVDYIPNRRAYQINIGKKELRRSPYLTCLKTWMSSQFDSGNITGQEIVSMIPPLLLQANASHYVLDMCAAPGSKSTQIIEDMMSSKPICSREGLLVANDVSTKRAYMLASQLQRLHFSNVVVTTHPAQSFPEVYDPKSHEKILFDRVLCDVPCSGDGIGRKDRSLFSKWSPDSALVLHPLQLSIAKRGLELLKVGGLMVYSTCSMNPIENNAVVAELLRRAKGSVEIVDASSILPKLKYEPGHTSWKVMAGRDASVFETWDDVPVKDGYLQKRLCKSMFPPTSTKEAKELGLDKTLRLLSHHHNTGSFFCCLLRKTKELPKSFKIALPKVLLKDEVRVEFQYEKSEEGMSKPPVKKRARIEKHVSCDEKNKPSKVSTDTYCPIKPQFHKYVNEMFGLDISSECLFTRGNKGGTVSYVSKNVANHFLKNQLGFLGSLKVVSAGVKVFCVRQSSDMFTVSESGEKMFNPKGCRILQSGVEIFVHLLKRRVYDTSLEEMLSMLNCPIGKVSSTADAFKLESTITDLKALPSGCLVIRLCEKDLKERVQTQYSNVTSVCACVFKGPTTINMMITEDDRNDLVNLLRDCRGDDSSTMIPGLEEALKEQDNIEREAAFTNEEEVVMMGVTGGDGDGDDGKVEVEEDKKKVEEFVDETEFDRAEMEVTGDGLKDDDDGDLEDDGEKVEEGEYLVV